MTNSKSLRIGPPLWPARPLPGAIAAGEVHVWAWSFGGAKDPSEADPGILDDHERRRAARFHFAPDRLRYAVCHLNMRRILASYIGQTPESLIFLHAPGGKPELEFKPADPPLHFNLSHSKTAALLAVALEMAVGVDVEDIRPIERDVAERFFSRAEVAAMSDLEDLAWLEAFYRCWTRKEAILKAEGLGLRIPLDSFDVSVRACEPAALLGARPESNLTAHWHLHDLAAFDGSMAALAVKESSSTIGTYAYQADAR